MTFRKRLFSFLPAALTAVIFFASALFAQVPDPSFPTYGTGAIEVRLYTDYFCPPCHAMEPSVEPVLKNLLKKKIIRLTFVDVPFNPASPLYARYFLYSLAVKNDSLHAIKVRNILFDAAAKKEAATKEALEDLLGRKRIAYAPFDAKTILARFNSLIQEDGIKATPTCVIIKGGKKEKFVGKIDILKALKQLP